MDTQISSLTKMSFYLNLIKKVVLKGEIREKACEWKMMERYKPGRPYPMKVASRDTWQLGVKCR